MVDIASKGWFARRDAFAMFGGGFVVLGVRFVLPTAANDNCPHPRTSPGKAKKAYGGKQAPVDYKGTMLTRALGLTDAQYFGFREAVASIEYARYDEMGGAARRFAGRYQMGKNEIRETAVALGEPVPSVATFLATPAMQERFFERYSLSHHHFLLQHSDRYAAAPVCEKLEVLGRAHNEGAAGAAKWLAIGEVHRDAFGTDPDVYAKSVREWQRKIGR